MGRKIVLHLHTNISDKKPSPSNIMTGELAINYAANGETLYIKNSEEAIAEFKDDKYYQKQLSELATKNELAQKQDIISDIDTIRNNAANYKGTVTGVKINGTNKNPSNGVVDLGTVITSHQDISGKQDKLVSGTNIKTINGESIIGSGDMVISGSGDPFVRVSDSETSGTLSQEDHKRLTSMSVLAILRNGTMYYLGETNLITDMYYYPHKPEEGFTEEYIFVPMNAPQWEFFQQA